MFRTLSQIEKTLLHKAEKRLREDLKVHLERVRKCLTEYGVADVDRSVADVYKLLFNHIETPLVQESILKHKADELVMKLEDLEDLVWDTVSDAQQSYP